MENPQGLPERTNEYAGDYAKACVAVAGECGIPVVDLWVKMQQCPGWRKDYLRYLKSFSLFPMLCLSSPASPMKCSFLDCKPCTYIHNYNLS